MLVFVEMNYKYKGYSDINKTYFLSIPGYPHMFLSQGFLKLFNYGGSCNDHM